MLTPLVYDIPASVLSRCLKRDVVCYGINMVTVELRVFSMHTPCLRSVFGHIKTALQHRAVYVLTQVRGHSIDPADGSTRCCRSCVCCTRRMRTHVVLHQSVANVVELATGLVVPAEIHSQNHGP